MKYSNIDHLGSFKKLKTLKPLNLHSSLTKKRVSSSSIEAGADLTYNWAAMPVGDEHLAVLQQLADEQQVIAKYRAILSGQIMNTGENRQVLHHLSRGRVLGSDALVYADGEEKGEFYQQELNKVAQFALNVRNAQIVGSTGKPFTTVVQIGIGGSDLGPRALYLALQGWASGQKRKQLQAHFISNVDPDDPAQVLEHLDLESTLFILVSKSGTTQETLTNADFVRQRMIQSGIKDLNPALHMVAVTSKTSPLAASDQFLTSFFIDDYIGGRYSSTSAVGAVVLSLAYGFDVFEQLLDGSHQADVAALNTDITTNAALLDALIGVYLRNVLHLPTVAILPYSQALSRFPAHLQQLDMESKSVNRDGQPIDYQTGPVVFGEPGTNGQHSFYQLLHQGTDTVVLQFIGFLQSQRGSDVTTDGSTSQTKLLANLIAQIVAFATGKEDANGNKRFSGNRYSSLLFATQLNPRSLGALLAHYENKVMFQGLLWNINSFDQEGVQLGKVLATKVLQGGQGDEALEAYMELLG